MKSIIFLLLLFVNPILYAQEVKPDTVEFSAVLKQGEQFSFGARSLRFKEVVSDSRCPKNVTCIWAGEAKVLLEVCENGKVVEERIVLINSNSVPLNFTAEGLSYFLNCLVLLPYPEAGTKEEVKNYTLDLQISGQPKEK